MKALLLPSCNRGSQTSAWRKPDQRRRVVARIWNLGGLTTVQHSFKHSIAPCAAISVMGQRLCLEFWAVYIAMHTRVSRVVLRCAFHTFVKEQCAEALVNLPARCPRVRGMAAEDRGRSSALGM
jgi:hypothetical protein